MLSVDRPFAARLDVGQARHQPAPAEGVLTGVRSVGVDRASATALRSKKLTIRLRGGAMKWKTPIITEIAVGLEINAYACVEVK
jgi:coenzyme PQQ precursor peptide PqqA